MPVGAVNYQGTGGIGNAGAGMGTAGAIARRWLGMMQGPPQVAPTTPDQDLAVAQAFGLPGAPPVPSAMGGPMPPPMTAGGAGIEGAPPMPGQRFAQAGPAAVPPMHPRGQSRAPIPVPVSRPSRQPVQPPPQPDQQQQAMAAGGPSRLSRAGGAALQYLAQQLGQRGQPY